MIPPIFPEDAPPGEKAVFQALASSEETHDWIVLHSLSIVEHVRNPEGEADFVIVAPGRGLLVIEVKSHDEIDYQDGTWRLGRHARTSRGPFKQASEAMYSIRQDLQRRGLDLRSLPTLSAVWFTGVRARAMLAPSPEWAQWQVLDSQDLQQDPIGAIRRTFVGGLAHLKERFAGYSTGEVQPDSELASRIARVLRPSFELGVVAGDLRNARQKQLVRFVEEQYSALDAMEDNRAVLFTGPAGSGKTFLAMEAARREIARGNWGRLLCFNSLLGRRLDQDLRDIPEVEVSTFHSLLLRIAGMQAPHDADESFWRVTLPDLALEVLLDAESDEAADFLIVDEVQDLLTAPYLDILNLLVKGGLSGGRVLLFGDFERQAIFDDGHGRQVLSEYIPHLPSHRLTMNCRNLPRIGFSVNLFSGLEPGYKSFRRDDDGANPVWIQYQRGEDQSEKLRQAIGALREDHFELSEIVVLSPLNAESVAAKTQDGWLRSVLEPADGGMPRRGKLRYSTIQAFKGLDAPAVVITDLDNTTVPAFESVMYVGLTRATDRLYGLIEKKTGLAGLEKK